MDIKLNFINESNDINNSSIVIFQKNVAESFDEIAVAWVVIDNCGVTDNHPFTYPMQFKVGAGDSNGNFMPQLSATNGEMFEVQMTQSGHRLVKAGTSVDPTEVEVRNILTTGSVSADIYRAGKKLATKQIVSPGQKAVFKFKPKIFIGVVSDVEEGDIMDSAIISTINTELDLLGISSADIVMTGGGGGPEATPFVFTLQNVV
ncbi:MAG: hypothetical protein GY765_00595 [bacterium]|nr:hypothetical protein [bacterium]